MSDNAAPPSVPYDNSMTAIFAHRRRAAAAALATNNQVIVPPIALLSGAGTLTADATVMPDWTAVRAEMIARLDAIEAGFLKIRPFREAVDAAYRERSHNNPPEPIDTLLLDAAEFEMGVAAANLARAELNAEHPRSDVMRLCGLVLNNVATGLWACVQWVAGKGDRFVDDFTSESAKRVAQAVVATEVLRELHVDLTAIVTQIWNVFLH